MTKKPIIVSVGVAIALIAYIAYMLIGVYPDVLITAQDRNIFAGDAQFFCNAIARPFGIFEYIGGFLTQFFYYPALGAAILIAIWIAIFFVGVRAFGLKKGWRALMFVPIACLFFSIIDLGYWIYCLNITGYWFSQSLVYLCLLLLLWAAVVTPPLYRYLWYLTGGILLFPILGCYSYIFAVCLFFSQFRKVGQKVITAKSLDVFAFILVIHSPIIFHSLFYTEIHPDDVFLAGFPIFRTPTDESIRLSIPFIIIAIFNIVLCFGRVFPVPEKRPAFIAYIVMGVATVATVWTHASVDDNYIYEMQMTQAAANDDWEKVISVAEKTKTPSRTMVVLKNIALMNTGELGKRSFQLGNNGVEINNPDSLNVNIMQIAAPVVYYNYGNINYAMRWCMEFGVSYGFSPYYMKMMARCAETTGEKELATRYIERMNRLLFYSDWKPAPASRIVKELQTSFPDALDADDNSCERYLFSILSRARKEDSPLISELSLFYSMIVRNPETFSSALYDYLRLRKSGDLPQEYEDAYLLFSANNPNYFPYRLEVSEETKQRFASFMDSGNRLAGYGYSEDGLRDALREDWGGTYWWFNAFGRTAY